MTVTPLTEEKSRNWRLITREYHRLEEEFVELTTYVPLSSDRNAHNYRFGSPRAAAHGWDCAAWVETAFRYILLNSRWDGDKEVVAARKGDQSINVYRDLLEPRYGLSQFKMTTLEVSLTVAPFEAFASGKCPEWFQKYSPLKHDRIQLAKEWTMLDTVECLAGLASLVHVGSQPGVPLSRASKVFQSLVLPGP